LSGYAPKVRALFAGSLLRGIAMRCKKGRRKMDCEVSTFAGIHPNPITTTMLSQLISYIRDGCWKNEIAAVRAATGEERDNLKKKLIGFTPSGTFTKRANKCLIRHSGLTGADLDDVENVEELREIARQDPFVVFCFASPSGQGLKLAFRTDSFDAVRDHVRLTYNAQVDEAAKDVARLCFISHDPAAFFNSDAEPLTSPCNLPTQSLTLTATTGAPQGTRNNAAFELACRCRDEGRTHAEAELAVLTFASSCTPPLPEFEARGCVRSAFSQPARPQERPLPDIVDAATFVAELIAPPAELVAGILHKGSKLAFGGSSKSFKTWNLLDLALSVATGGDWLGFHTEQGKVLFVNFEIQAHAWQKRIQAVAIGKGITLQPGSIQLWNLRGHGADFRRIVPKMIERCRADNFALIVLDPIYKIYGGTDENAAGDVAALLNEIERLATETGAAVAFGAHFAKGNASGKEAIDRISGSGVFARDPDSLLIFTKHEENDCFTVEPILRNFAPVEPFAVRWAFPLMHRDDDLDPTKLKQTVGAKKKHDPKNLLSHIADSSPQQPVSMSEWARRAGVKRPTLISYVEEMRSKEWVQTIGEGTNGRKCITEKGKAFLRE
jgi:hypothetical protein